MHMTKDLAKTISRAISIKTAAYTDSITGEEFDAKYAVPFLSVAVFTGTITAAGVDNRMDFKVQQSDVSGGTFVDADAAQYPDQTELDGSTAVWDKKIDAADDDDKIFSFNFIVKPGFPVLRLVATETGIFDGTFTGIIEYEKRLS